VISFNVPGWPARQVGAILSEQYGIGVRSGKFCAHPLLERFGGADRGAVRASLGLASTDDDVDALLDALSELLSR
jgi:selenocysteine lyase/cysteine desulfurase